MISTNIAAIAFATLLIMFRRLKTSPHYKAMIAASLFLMCLQLVTAIMYGGLYVLDVGNYIQRVLYASQKATGQICQENDCDDFLMSTIRSMVQGVRESKNDISEFLAVVASALSFVAQGVTTLILVAQEKAANPDTDSGNATAPPTKQDFAASTSAPKMDYSDL